MSRIHTQGHLAAQRAKAAKFMNGVVDALTDMFDEATCFNTQQTMSLVKIEVNKNQKFKL